MSKHRLTPTEPDWLASLGAAAMRAARRVSTYHLALTEIRDREGLTVEAMRAIAAHALASGDEDRRVVICADRDVREG